MYESFLASPSTLGTRYFRNKEQLELPAEHGKSITSDSAVSGTPVPRLRQEKNKATVFLTLLFRMSLNAE
jgi:hypothetical protein